MKVDTTFNILASYAYMGKNSKFAELLSSKAKNKELNFMIDSGAFTCYNAKTKKDFINVDDYCRFLERYGSNCEKYVMLDVVLNERQSKQNYETMVNRGFKPMFVVTANEKDFRYVKDTLAINPNICVAGGVTEPMEWCCRRYQNVFFKTDRKAKIHGLGFVKFPNMFKLPLASVDSSTWNATAQRFGNAVFFENGLKTLRYFEVLKKGKNVPLFAQRQMNEVKITPKMYSDIKNHRGANSIEVFLSIIAYIKYQKYAKRCGLDLFLACGCLENILRISYVYENWHNLDFNKYLNYFDR